MENWVGLALGLFLLGGARAGAETRDRLPVGSWGGEHVSIEVEEAEARFEFDCAHATIHAPWRLTADGRFSLKGVFVREHGGPVRKDEEQIGRPVVFKGRYQGGRLEFEFELTEEKVTEGPFVVTLGGRPHIFKCK